MIALTKYQLNIGSRAIALAGVWSDQLHILSLLNYSLDFAVQIYLWKGKLKLSNSIDYINFPSHISIIMDGNGRWAKKRLLPRSVGHKAGADTLRELIDACQKENLKYLSVYAFSTENWRRDKEEIEYLMNILRGYIKQYIDDVDKNNIKITVIGDHSILDKDLQEKIAYIHKATEKKQGLHLVIALSYGGRDEIVRAVKKLTAQVIKSNINIDTIDENSFERYLDTYDIPDPELLIRTSGEQRISNFLLWQTAYTEIYYTEKLWPDFTIEDLKEAVLKFQKRDRRFGGI